MILSFIVVALSLLYFLSSLIIRRGIKNHPKSEIKYRTVTVIVSARNEAENIQACLESLARLVYPENRLEIVVVNDRSEDGTHDIVQRFVEDRAQFKYLTVTTANPNLSGKANAVAHAMRESRGEIVLITDADCTVPTQWVRTMNSHFNDNVGMVAGFTLVNHDTKLFAKLQTFDWAYLLAIGAGAMGLGRPLSCIGNNFGFRRIVYEEVGGFEAIGFSITEDFALMKKIDESTQWDIIFPVEENGLVASRPIRRIRDFFSQRKRWALGGQSVHWFGKALISLSVLTHFLIPGALFWGAPLSSIAAPTMAILLGDWLVLLPVLSRLRRKRLLLLWPIYKLFFLFYSLGLLFSLLFSRKVVWKGIPYTARRMVQNKANIG